MPQPWGQGQAQKAHKRSYKENKWAKDKIFKKYVTESSYKRKSELKNETSKKYVTKSDSAAQADYSQWKATKRIRFLQTSIPPIRTSARTWARLHEEITHIFAEHLFQTFTPLMFQRKSPVLAFQPTHLN